MNKESEILIDKITQQNRTIHWRTVELRDCAEERDRYKKRMDEWREIARAFMGEPISYRYTEFNTFKYWLVKLLVHLIIGRQK